MVTVKRFLTPLLFISMLGLSLHAEETPLRQMVSLYKKGYYKKACNVGLRYFEKYKKNNDFVMLYGFSCLHADYIDRLAVPLTALRYTPTERKNATYFATILLQKKMLYQKLLDGLDLSTVRLPVTDHVISIVFDLIVHRNYEKKRGVYFLTDPNRSGKSYKLYLESHKRGPHMIVEEIVDGKTVKIHRYW
ncbi:MAG: hypothetical protein GXO33_01430 [Epsilonproteobacteria bacterium]|nr:hypothetical protein [Campylobacterota bacterium]